MFSSSYISKKFRHITLKTDNGGGQHNFARRGAFKTCRGQKRAVRPACPSTLHYFFTNLKRQPDAERSGYCFDCADSLKNNLPPMNCSREDHRGEELGHI